MKIAFHTNAFVWAGITDIKQIADFAALNDFDAIEVGPGIDLNKDSFESVLRKISISNFIYCRNFINDNEEKAQAERTELYRRMEFAAAIGVTKFVFSTGISRNLSIPESSGCDPLLSLDRVIAFLDETLEKAEALNLTMLIENCPMYRNIATSPFMWQKIFERIPSKRLGLCYDPSHFVWQMIDPIKPIRIFADRIQHIHLKDTLIDRKVLDQVGILHNVGSEKGLKENQWWRHTIMGNGEINWSSFKTALDDIHYDQGLSFEMEDCDYELDPALVEKGLRIQRAYLKKNWCI